jgi:hypothetical protein
MFTVALSHLTMSWLLHVELASLPQSGPACYVCRQRVPPSKLGPPQCRNSAKAMAPFDWVASLRMLASRRPEILQRADVNQLLNEDPKKVRHTICNATFLSLWFYKL